jgi:hypothetical protein
VGERVCTGWVGLHVTADEMKIQSYLHVVKIFFCGVIPKGQTNLIDYKSGIYLICTIWTREV